MQWNRLVVVMGCLALATTLCSCPHTSPGAGGQLTATERQLCESSAYAATLLSQAGAVLEPVLSEVVVPGGGGLAPLVAADLQAAFQSAFHAQGGVHVSDAPGGAVLVELDGLVLSPADLRVDGAMTISETADPVGLSIVFGPLQIANGAVAGTLHLELSGQQWVASTADPLDMAWDVPIRHITASMADLSWSFAGGGARTLAGALNVEGTDEITTEAETAVTLAALSQDSFSAFPQSGTITVPLEGFTGTLTFTGSDQATLSSGYDWTLGIALPDSVRHYTLGRHIGGASAVAVSGDGERVLSTGADGYLKCWAADGSAVIGRATAHAAGGSAVAWAPDDATAVSSGLDGVLRSWSTATWTQLGQLTATGHASALAFSPAGGGLLVGALSDGTVQAWQLETGGGLTAAATLTTAGGSTPTIHTGGALALAFSPDGTLLATGGADSVVRLWSLAGGVGAAQFLGTLTGHTAAVTGLGFLPDGTLVSTGADSSVRMWDTTTRAAIGEPGTAPVDWETTGYGCLAVDAVGGTVGTGASDTGGIVWWTRKKNAIKTSVHCVASLDDTVALAAAPDGRAIASASLDGTVKLVPTGVSYVP